MATVDYSPLFNSLRNAGTNMANMALKGIEAEGQAAKAALWRDQTLANTALSNSKTRIYDQKYETLSDIINRVKAAHGGDDPYSVDEQNRLVSAVGTHNYFPNQPIGNTGYVVNKASGEVSGGDNPLAENYLKLLQGKTAAQIALAGLSNTKAQAGGFAPRAGTMGGTARARNDGLKIPDLFTSYVEVDDGMGGKRTMAQVDRAAMTAMAGRILARNGNPMDVNEYLREFQAESQGAPTVDMRPDSPTAGQVNLPRAPAGVDPMSVPEIQSKVKEAQEAAKAGDMTDEEFLTLLNQMGIK